MAPIGGVDRLDACGHVEHLGGAEWHWFQGVVAGAQPDLPGDVDEDRPAYDPMTVVFTSDEPSTEILDFYRHAVCGL